MGRYEVLLLWLCLQRLAPFLSCGAAVLDGDRAEDEGTANAGCWISSNWVGVLGLSKLCQPLPHAREPWRSCSD